VAIHQQHQIRTVVDKQTQQQTPLHQLPMGQIYWNKYDVERPDYETYIQKLEQRSRIDEELAEIERQEEAKRQQEEIQKAIAESKIIETDLETKEKKIINVHN
jgi:oligoribonuclease NrnB/cAMP/cGMP phosphodiesterase (DHH superfamily)